MVLTPGHIHHLKVIPSIQRYAKQYFNFMLSKANLVVVQFNPSIPRPAARKERVQI